MRALMLMLLSVVLLVGCTQVTMSPAWRSALTRFNAATGETVRRADANALTYDQLKTAVRQDANFGLMLELAIEGR